MDWFRRLFGFPDNRSYDGGSFQNPSWEDIREYGNYSARPHSPDNHYDSFSFSMGHEDDSFSSVFGQMDDMFRQLDSIMQGFHGFHGNQGHVFITDVPDSDDSSSQSPRDSLLKKPNSLSPGNANPRHVPPDHRSTFTENRDEIDPQGNDHFGMKPGGPFGGLREFGIIDPFKMTEEFFKSFGSFGTSPFEWNPGVSSLPSPGREPEDNPRDSVVKKDSDFDNRINGDFSEFLKDVPGYNPPIIPGQPRLTPPENLHPQPRVQQRFQSTSIIRIRKPDGSVEETCKYTDSTGREEVTVTHTV